ncbi:hypothetical protein F2Q69_00044620 [Brassica cretica]|uniref:SWIM-type domain-containing protein n=1 Tax=Brassica cretica TaxID=69181 RepID=A0A8S9NSC3_BRACR|nr:hypothetical protein F2Q69_00044620 [Brassica cretica]
MASASVDYQVYSFSSTRLHRYWRRKVHAIYEIFSVKEIVISEKDLVKKKTAPLTVLVFLKGNDMGQLVKLVPGWWVRHAQGVWKFDVDHVEAKYDMVVRENESFEALLEMVKEKFRLGERLLPSEPVLLTYDYPNPMTVPGEYTNAPVEIKEDGDVQMFMAVKLDFVNLHIYVMFDYRAVEEYETMRRTEYRVLAGQTTPEVANQIVPPGTKDEEWLRCTQGYNGDKSSEAHGYEQNQATQTQQRQSEKPTVVIEELSDSSTDSNGLKPGGMGCGRAVPFITLLDEEASPIPEADLSLTIATNVGSSHYEGLASKGKGKVFEEREAERPRGTKLDEEESVPDCEILGEDMAKGDDIYTGQVFVDKEAFKLHMSLYAIANKFSYRVKRSEPGKMVLECSGNNCEWRVYAAKIGGCPKFEIKTLVKTHMFSVDERNFMVSTGYGVNHIINADEYEVQDDNGMFYRVDLAKRSFSCKEFDALGFPCTHAVSASVKASQKVESLVSTASTEQGSIHLLPPYTRRPPESPRKSRILLRGEFKLKGKFKVRRACSRCGGANHNRTTCKMPI